MIIEAPWYTHQKKLKVLFDGDREIKVRNIEESDDGYQLDILVYSHAKYMALQYLIDPVKIFGNVRLNITVYDVENQYKQKENILQLYEDLFHGNPILKDTKIVTDRAGTVWGFVRFQPQVLQFFHDDISDYNGNWSGLAQDITKEVFRDTNYGVFFCTADIRENGDKVVEPLGKWP